MNVSSTSLPPKNDVVSLQMLAQWLKANGAGRFDHPDPRSLMSDRYPHGLFSDAEMDALVSVFKP